MTLTIFGKNPGRVKDLVAAFGDVGRPQSARLETVYKDLEFEQRAYREAGQNEKALSTYDKSLERLQAVGFERHPRPAEVFGLLIDGLEGKLSPAEKAIFDDMLTSYGEWLSMAVKREGNILTTYLDPEGLVWNGSVYEVRGSLKYSDKREFDITGIPSQQFIDLERFPDAFIQYGYNRSFQNLPQEMRQRSKRAQVYLPSEGSIWPVGRDVFGFYVDFGGGGASRGVRRK